MVCHLDPYTFKLHFMEKLSLHIIETMMKYWHVTSEETNIDQLPREALSAENTHKSMGQFRQSKDKGGTIRSSGPHKNMDSGTPCIPQWNYNQFSC